MAPKLDFLDHVAIRVKDLEVSARWYEEVLGLKRYAFREWGDYPILMLAGKTGVALFPSDESDSPTIPAKISHFAFQVDEENFEKAREHYEAQDIAYQFQDHVFFHSLYILDPDGHQVELTTLVVDEHLYYQS